MRKLFRLTTIPLSLDILLNGQLAFLNKYFDVTAISSPGDELNSVHKREQVKVVPLPMEREISLVKDIKSLLGLISLFRKERPFIVHSNTPKSSLLGMLAARITNVPKRIYTVTGLRYETESGLKRWLFITMEKITCLCATHVIAESIGVKRMLFDQKITSRPVLIIGNGNINGIDEDFWDPNLIDDNSKQVLMNELELSSDDFIFLFVGRVSKDKGIEELVSAFKKLNSSDSFSKLIIVGPLEKSSNISENILREIHTNRNIISLGFRSDVREIMSISDTLVLPGYREGFPNVILQAGAMELPVIVTDVNGVFESVTSHTGIIIEKRSIDSLLKAMLEIRNNRNLFSGKNCRKVILSRFSQKKFYPELLNYYKHI